MNALVVQNSVFDTFYMSLSKTLVQNPRHKCDWDTRMITDKKIIADST